MRILCDRHHADLLYSLQLLFEDRLGVDLYVPVGHEWWDEGYWQFGICFGDDRLARQYLNPDAYTPGDDGQYTTFDSAHTERVIRGVSLAAAKQMDWDFVLATVPENQVGFASFAASCSARYLYHVGNTGQYVNWDLNPTVLSNSTEHEGVLMMHQEIDSGAQGIYAYQPLQPEDARTGRCFVNHFFEMPGYGDFMEAEAQLHEFNFTLHGHDGRDGNIEPASRLAALMARSGWGWHDKSLSDGFGHVIHAWAAVGRPLIGRSRYYRGKLAEPFWQHEETCIDLDLVSFHDALGLVRDISADPARHRAMCEAMRAEFDRQVDYEAEAAAVAALLGLTS
jgi:hypothetical protein